MNPIAVATALTTMWALIPEDRREKYVNKLLDTIEELSADAIAALRSDNTEETVEEGDEDTRI
jgi:hypothetical protein